VKTDGVNKDLLDFEIFLSPHPEGSLLWHDRPDTPHTIINAPPRGPCAGDIDQPPLASSAVHREVPALAESTSHLSADRTTETVTVSRPRHSVAPPPPPSSTRTPTSVALRPLGVLPLGASPPWCYAPWCFAPLGLRPDVRLRPVTLLKVGTFRHSLTLHFGNFTEFISYH
jgi:hypothetical protein